MSRNEIDDRAMEIHDGIIRALKENVPVEELNVQGFREACFKCAVLEMKLKAEEEVRR